MKAALLWLSALALVAPAAAQPAPIRVEIEQFTLPNGLRVILHRDTITPTIATNIWYHVGSAQEAPGRTGFAHLFEHIMFEGSRNVPEGAIDEWFGEVGGAPNGSTAPDRTNYMQSFSASALELALFIESDRMGHLLPAMSPASVDGQRDVVKNERRQSYDNVPYGLADQVLTEAMYPAAHPYSWPVIGYMDHLTNASYQDVVDFFRRYYAPNNASLVIAGDIDVERTRALVGKWFADVPRGAAVTSPEVSPPRLEGAPRLRLEDRVQLPRIDMRWITAAAYQPDDAALITLGRILGAGKNSRLYRRLVYELQIADDVAVRQDSRQLNGEFEISATARAGRDLDELDRVIMEEVARLQREPPDARELARAVNQYEVGFLEQLERVDAKADALNEYLFYTGRPDYFNEDLARFRALTPSDISNAARRWLDAQARVTLSIVPEGRPELAVEGSRPVPNHDLELSPPQRKPTS
ncbi:MAG TPA: pitrilysin family protein [Longimicrobiales bacterium]|nr:pitrilysin family protein [Longimicrobiales bacterium]